MPNLHFDEEEKEYREILQNNPKNAKAALNLGNLLEEKGDMEGATKVLLESFKLNYYCTALLREYYRLTKNDFYIPMVIDANPEKHFEYKDYKAIALNIIKSMGRISYKYILYLYKGENVFPIYYVSLEKNNLFEELGGPSHFLCAFEKGQGHVNYGGFEEEVTIENFTRKALEIVMQKYKLDEDFKEV